MDKDEALKLLRGGEEGIAEWNRWREDGREIPDLDGADLHGAILSGAILIRAHLSEANLHGANLRKANLSEAHLHRADLNGANLSLANLNGANLSLADLNGANLIRANLSEANLHRANLNGANLSLADLNGAVLSGADLNGANLSGAVLNGAKLSLANLNGANLSLADLHGAILSRANLSETVLLGTRGLRLDGQFIRNAQFSPRARDPWSVLRRNYTGPMILVHLLFLLAFLAPYATRAAIWTGVNRIQERMDLTPAEPTEEWPLWMLLIGWDKGITYAGTAILLIAYNVLRALLTWWLAQLRDIEERSGFAPTWNSYKHSFWAHHYFMRYVFWFAVLSFLWHAIPWLFHVVELPQRA